MSPTTDLTCQRRGALGHIELQRPQALNAISHAMVLAIDAALDDWEHDPAISAIAVSAVPGRAFSAGGDIRHLYDLGRAGNHDAQMAFWRDEYALNLRISRLSKPYVALVDGLVMGGGVGVALHGSHVVAGDGWQFAMPEVGIGFFPDIGASHFLPKLPGASGMRLALTGARVGADEAHALGLATHRRASHEMAALLDGLAAGASIAQLLPKGDKSAHSTLSPGLDHAYQGTSLAGIIARLAALAPGDARAAGDLAAIGRHSPTSLAVALRQMQRGRGLDLEQALAMELCIVSHLCRDHDFYEGTRAMTIDKDKAPRWVPDSIEAVDPARIEAWFAAPWQPGDSMARARS
ncbi:MAG: enoyl-CoA hydratase/isomerase family protein [Hyphomicrobiales bacterium]|nr:enoyl-CoA hydratase/isomerase family protein [Hyphomicrobiales bacterium]